MGRGRENMHMKGTTRDTQLIQLCFLSWNMLELLAAMYLPFPQLNLDCWWLIIVRQRFLWICSDIGFHGSWNGVPLNLHLNNFFSTINHLFWDTSIYGNPQTRRLACLRMYIPRSPSWLRSSFGALGVLCFERANAREASFPRGDAKKRRIIRILKQTKAWDILRTVVPSGKSREIWSHHL